MDLGNYRKKVNDSLITFNLKQKELEEKEESLKVTKQNIVYAEEALFHIQKVAKETQQNLEYFISHTVSLALEFIFPDPYKFRITYEEKRNKTEANLFLEKNGKIYDPLNSTGGGVADIVSFSLKVALLCLAKKKTRPILILDEPFKNLSQEYKILAGEMVKDICRKLEIQIIMFTHIQEIVECADKVFRFGIKDGVSYLS